MKTAHVIGLGRSGIAAARVLLRQGWQVTLSDSSAALRHQSDAKRLRDEGVNVKLNHAFSPEPDLDLLVVSPGVPWDAPALLKARAQGIETIGEMELAWRSLRDRPWLAITGTNGKTTTTALVAAIFKAAGLNAPACGNIGYAACELALTEPPDWVIAELSSYQIEASASLAPTIGIWTTFTPDHLSRHKTVENYYAIKASLLARSQSAILNGDDPYLRSKAAEYQQGTHWTSVKGKDAWAQSLQGTPTESIAPPPPDTYIEAGWVIHKGEKIVETKALRMVGEHNQQNLLVAVAAARLAGIEASAIAQGVSSFPGVSHRLEHICTWRGVDFINDSKATNYDAAEVGLRSVSAPAILIAGGASKDGDDTAWIAQIKAKAAAVLLVGDAADAFAERLQACDYPHYEIVQTIDRAVARSTELSKEQSIKTVLLSPACASFDQYANFEVRGDDFRQVCTKYLGEL